MNTQTTLPEGFTAVGQTGTSLVFQSPSKWGANDITGRMVQGIYNGLTEKDAFGKQNFSFTATADGSSFDAEGQEREYSAGSTVIINSNGSLSKKLAEVATGLEVIVDYDGKAKIKKGAFKGKEAHNFSVYVKGQ